MLGNQRLVSDDVISGTVDVPILSNLAVYLLKFPLPVLLEYSSTS